MLEVPEAHTPDNGKACEIVGVDRPTLDNQQERLVRQAQLAMLFDCEGYITVRVVNRATKVKQRNIDISPIVGMSNVSHELIDWTADALEKLGVPRYVWWSKKHGGPWEKHLQGRVLVYGFKRVEVLLPLIRPFLIVKGKQADLLQRFIDLRMIAWSGGSRQRDYSEEELQLANTIRDLNVKGYGWRPVSSTSLRDGSEQLRRKLGRTVMDSDLRTKDGEAAEMTARQSIPF
jgi:hypothetical protein